ncbi:hypothetical protein SLS58_002656 [Diplodia intermedia]|uniref:Uncharacterized protein n=1 Tax=Diplodia intermedia TaxID=856260 RepID=A0ABR3TYS2_9PEZI
MANTTPTAEDNEQSPLLPQHPAPSASKAAQGRSKWSPAAISYLFLLVIIAGVAGDAVSTPALTRIYESIYCRQYFAEHDPSLIGRDGGDNVPEKLCKIAEVQGQVAMLKAWQTFFDAIGSRLHLHIEEHPWHPGLTMLQAFHSQYRGAGPFGSR